MAGDPSGGDGEEGDGEEGEEGELAGGGGEGVWEVHRREWIEWRKREGRGWRGESGRERGTGGVGGDRRRGAGGAVDEPAAVAEEARAEEGRVGLGSLLSAL